MVTQPVNKKSFCFKHIESTWQHGSLSSHFYVLSKVHIPYRIVPMWWRKFRSFFHLSLNHVPPWRLHFLICGALIFLYLCFCSRLCGYFSEIHFKVSILWMWFEGRIFGKHEDWCHFMRHSVDLGVSLGMPSLWSVFYCYETPVSV